MIMRAVSCLASVSVSGRPDTVRRSTTRALRSRRSSSCDRFDASIWTMSKSWGAPRPRCWGRRQRCPWAGPAAHGSGRARAFLPRNDADALQRLGHHLALEGADVGHRVGAFGRGAGAEREEAAETAGAARPARKSIRVKRRSLRPRASAYSRPRTKTGFRHMRSLRFPSDADQIEDQERHSKVIAASARLKM